MKIIIGLVGEKGGGKGTFKNLLAELVPGKQIKHIKFSDVLVDTLNLWGIPTTRENLQKLPVAMNKTYGEGSLTKAVYERINTIDADIVILDGIRWESDAQMLRQFPHNFLVYITADARLRHERTKARKEKAGEENTTLEQFMKEEQAETEKYIPQIGLTANFKITNNGDLDDFRRQVERFCRIYLSIYI